VSIKAADHIAALTALSKHLGLFAGEDKPQDPTVVNNITNNLMVLESMSEIERIRRVATMLRDAARAEAAKTVEAEVLGNYTAGSFHLGAESGGGTGTMVTDPPVTGSDVIAARIDSSALAERSQAIAPSPPL
jgi:hypothetical protein